MTDTTPRPSWETLPLDQAAVLRSAAIGLSDEFRGVFGPETVERFLHTSFNQFAARATVPQFLPLMAERFARQRLRALAKVEGLHGDGRPTVLFVCVHNAGRSQMAAGYLQRPRRRPYRVLSAGSEPADQVNPAAVRRWPRKASTSPPTTQAAQRPRRPGRRRRRHDGLR